MSDPRYPFVWTSPTGTHAHLATCGQGGTLTVLASWESPCSWCRDEWDAMVRRRATDDRPDLLLALFDREAKDDDGTRLRAMTLVVTLVRQATEQAARAAL